jgi:S-adenosylmethionine decarboxylase
MHGTEWLIDARGCSPAKLRDRVSLLALLDRIVATMDVHVVATAVHVFPGPGGITALYLLSESHLTIHTFPETGIATLNVYCCTPRKPAPWKSVLGEMLGAQEVHVTEHPRGGGASSDR